MGTADDISVRPLTRSDEADWRRLWKDYLAFYETEVADEIYTTYFERLLGNDPCDYSGLLIEVNGVPKGLAHYLFHRHGWRIEDTCYLQDLYVDPDCRGLGLGRKLIEAVYDKADAHGANPVYWLTQEFNTTARQLYDRLATKTPFVQYSCKRM